MLWSWSAGGLEPAIFGGSWVIFPRDLQVCEVYQSRYRFDSNWFDTTWIELVTSCGDLVLSVPI